MKKILLAVSFFTSCYSFAQVNVSGTVNEKANEKTGEAIDAIWNASKKKDKDKKDKDKNDKSGDSGSSQSSQQSSSTGSGSENDSPKMKAYQNYDFVPGDKIIFEDNFHDDTDGEFPAHWKLEGGQAAVNKSGNDKVLSITEYYSVFNPRITQSSYLPEQYTVEYDTWLDEAYDSNEGVYIEFRNAAGEKLGSLNTSRSSCVLYFGNSKLEGKLDPSIGMENYLGKWHHMAVAVNGKQIKVYCDQFRVVVVPDCGFKANSLVFGGNASHDMGMFFGNVRIASGGSMNLVGKKFTDTKIITHGITFDYDKSTIKPESMGTLNMIVQVMKDNPDIKFEVGGHTDSDGDDAYNQKLSQQRADAVKAQLVKMGVADSRLTAKGYGESKPVSDNTSPEGKANNRRVEFVKQ